MEEAAAEAMKASDPPELPRRCRPYWEAYRRLVPYTFLEASEAPGETKSHFPAAEKWPTIASDT